jgi:hypothetical protein
MSHSEPTIITGKTGIWDTSRGVWLEAPHKPGTSGEPVRHFVGLDLGQSADYTALAVVRRTIVVPGTDQSAIRLPARSVGDLRNDARYDVVHLQRFPLGTPYAAIGRDVAALLARPPLSDSKTTLLVDATGSGMLVVDSYRAVGMKPIAVIITSGATATCVNAFRWHVPKRDLVASLQLPLQAGRLKVASRLPEAATLQRELLNFRVRITPAANDTYAAWREGEHDDTVLAVALAVWAGEALRKRQLRVY